MKLSRKTKRRIRKGITFARNLFFILFGIFVMLTICSASGEHFEFTTKCFGLAVVCFGVSYILDCLFFEHAYRRDEE